MVRIATRTARTASKGNGMVGDYDRLRRRGHIISLSHKAVPLYSELPRRLILGNPNPYARIGIRHRGVGKRSFACSASFLEEFSSETGRGLRMETSIKGELVTPRLIHKSHNQPKSIGSRKWRNANA